MAFKAYLKKRENFIGALLLILVVLVFTAVRYDYYFDLNDDVLMKDILAGVYTGTPEGHNIQMLWLVSAFISVFYRIIRGLPWYGIFLCVCHYGSLFLVVHKSLSFCRKWTGKLMLLLAEGVLIIALFLDHLVSAQLMPIIVMNGERLFIMRVRKILSLILATVLRRRLFVLCLKSI